MSVRLFLMTIVVAMYMSATAYAKVQNDPFMKTWLRTDGTRTYELIIAESHAPNSQGYRVSYNLKNGSYLSDMCVAVSNTRIQCPYGTSLTRDDAQHSITLTESLGTFTYYEPDFMPNLSPFLGSWKGKLDPSHDDKTIYGIKLMQATYNNEYLVLTTALHPEGNCGGGLPLIYRVTNNPDNTLLFTYETALVKYQFKLDPVKMQITPVRDYSIGECILPLADYGLILTKE